MIPIQRRIKQPPARAATSAVVVLHPPAYLHYLGHFNRGGATTGTLIPQLGPQDLSDTLTV